MSGNPFSEEEDDDDVVAVNSQTPEATPLFAPLPQQEEDASIEDVLDIVQSLALAVCINPECGWRGPWWRLEERKCPCCESIAASLFELEEAEENADESDPNG